VAGSDDLATPPDVLESLAALISGAQFELYPSVGHLPCIEVPDMLADEIIKHREALT
jgi:pimeloyl-ACP methyl ester carboxylesterase